MPVYNKCLQEHRIQLYKYMCVHMYTQVMIRLKPADQPGAAGRSGPGTRDYQSKSFADQPQNSLNYQ